MNSLRFFLILKIILSVFCLKAQYENALIEINEANSNKFDSATFFDYSIRNINLIKDEKNYKLYEYTVDLGLRYNSLSHGIWNVFDRNSTFIIASFYYVKGDLIKAIHYDKGRCITIIHYETIFVDKRDSTDTGIANRPIEIYSFNKKGKLVMHSKLQDDGMVIQVKYKGKREKVYIYDPKKYDSRGKPL